MKQMCPVTKQPVNVSLVWEKRRAFSICFAIVVAFAISACQESTAPAHNSTKYSLSAEGVSADNQEPPVDSYEQLVTAVQREINRLGHTVPITGRLDKETREAVRSYRRAVGIPVLDDLSHAFLERLKARQSWPMREFRDCDICPKMIALPTGSFVMGSDLVDWGGPMAHEWPPHKVSVSSFALGKAEVTYKQWEACAAKGGCTGSPSDYMGFGRGERPVTDVSWHDAQEYVEWLSKETGKRYRLPSEAEWEYAARAGSNTHFNTGDCISTAQSNFGGGLSLLECPSSSGKDRTLPVGSLPANSWGLHDMHGNVAEWVQDCWNHDYKNAPLDGEPWMTGDCYFAVVRGGSYLYLDLHSRSASRMKHPRDQPALPLGFRVARDL